MQSDAFAADPSIIVSADKPSYKVGESATLTVTGGLPNTPISWTSWKHDPATNTLVITNVVPSPGGVTDKYGNWKGALSQWTRFAIGVLKVQAVTGARKGFITFAVTPILTVNSPVIVPPTKVSHSVSGGPPNTQIIWETWFNGALQNPQNPGQYFGFDTDANGNWTMPADSQFLQPFLGNGLYKRVAVIGNHRASVEYTVGFNFTVDKAVYNVNDRVSFSLTGAPPNTPIFWNTWLNGVQVGANAYYGHSTNANGNWSSQSGQYLPQFVGVWRQRISVGGQQFELAYNVTPAPLYNVYTKKIGGYLWIGPDRENDLKLYEAIYGRFVKLTFFDDICQGGLPTTLTWRAQNFPVVNKSFSNPNIHTYQVVTQDAAITNCGKHPLFISNPSALNTQKLSEIANEYKEFTLYLYQQYKGSGKRFILSTFEADNNLYCGEPFSYIINAPKEAVWVEDAVPEGATIAADNDSWTFVSSNPTPFSKDAAHQSSLYDGVHQHFFYGATQTLGVNLTSTLFTYVYLDPANPPRQIMLQWNEGNWEHRAYWGENLIGWGTDGTDSRRYMGPLPTPGQWARLEIPATSVFDFPPKGQGPPNVVVNGMAFTLYGGRATWDKSGVTTPFRDSCNTAFGEPYPGYPEVDGPRGVAQNLGKWFEAAQKGVFEGRKQAARNGWYGAEVYYAPEIVSENLLQNAPLPGPPPDGQWVSLLDNLLPTLNPGLDSDGEPVPRYDFVSYSAYDSVNQAINNPSSTALVDGLNRMASVAGTGNIFIGEFSYNSGQFSDPAVREARTDKVFNDALFKWRGDSLVPGVPYVNWWEIKMDTWGLYNPAGDQLVPIGVYFKNKLSKDVVWVDEDSDIPIGERLAAAADASMEMWETLGPGFTNPLPFSGSYAFATKNPTHGDNPPVLHQIFFQNAQNQLKVNAGESLYAHVYLDPAKPPEMVMLQWRENGSWEHRAYWGSNMSPWGVDGTPSRRYMGPLPQKGGWVRLEIPANDLVGVGLEGKTVTGFAFTLFKGRGAFDRVGKFPPEAAATVACDDGYDLYFNGSYRGSGSNWMQSQTYNLTPQSGKNVVAIRGMDAGGIAGLLAEIQVAGQRLGSNTAWKVSLTAPPNWTDVNFDDSGWANATDYGSYGISPWGTLVSGMPIDTPAKWIWSSNNDAHDVVYFRFSFIK